jgi:hypothetical protein
MVTRTVLPVLTGTCHQPAALLYVEHRLFLEQADRGTMAILAQRAIRRSCRRLLEYDESRSGAFWPGVPWRCRIA